jgi:hypothetical protein
MEPGSSAGRSAVDGKEAERGRSGRGLCMEAGLGNVAEHGAGERKMSLSAACRVEAALVM